MTHPFLSPVARPVWPAPVVFLPLLLLGACGGASGASDAYFALDRFALGVPLPTGVPNRPAPSLVAGTSPSRVAVSQLSPSPTAALSAIDGFCGLPGLQADLLQRINAARASPRSCGSTAYPAAGSLNWHRPLFTAAERHSRDMAVNNYFSHTGLDGRSVSHRVSSAGYAWRSVGENIAAGPSSASAVMGGWLASPGHCGNIMSAQYRDVAVACVQRPGSTYGRYWTMVLARPA